MQAGCGPSGNRAASTRKCLGRNCEMLIVLAEGQGNTKALPPKGIVMSDTASPATGFLMAEICLHLPAEEMGCYGIRKLDQTQ